MYLFEFFMYISIVSPSLKTPCLYILMKFNVQIWGINSETDLSSRCTEGAIGGHRDGVQESRVTDVIGLQLAVGQIPHLKQTKHYQWKVTHVDMETNMRCEGKKLGMHRNSVGKRFLAKRGKKAENIRWKYAVITAIFFCKAAQKQCALWKALYKWVDLNTGVLVLTLTILSQPQETMMGLLLFGEKRTQDTHSVWDSSWGTKQASQCGSITRQLS